MKLPIMRSAAISLLLASGLPVVLGGAMEFKGCYSSTAGMTDKGKYTFQSSGYCQQQCQKDGSKVFALWKGSNCLCGDKLPPESDKVSKDKCDVTCDGWPQDMCGGKNTYSVYLVDESDESSVSTASSGDSSSSSSTATDTSAPTTTHIETNNGQTVVVTSAPESQGAETKEDDGGKSNTAAIAAGVVVGVVGFFALIGAAFFFYRFKKRKAGGNYLNNGPIEHYNKPMSTSSNSRFDGDFMAQRRQSNGSIDDDQDFSRRILQVTNPDR